MKTLTRFFAAPRTRAITTILNLAVLAGLAIAPALPSRDAGSSAAQQTGSRLRFSENARHAFTSTAWAPTLFAAHSPKLSNATANAAADAVAALMNNGYLKFYTTAQPATADTALGAQTLLATLRFNATAFAAASSGVATANAITSDTNAPATGTADWFRILKSDNTTVVMDGSLGTSGADINLATTSIVTAGTVSVSAFTYTQSKS